MENVSAPSSSLSFASPSYVSNGSSSNNITGSTGSEAPNLEHLSLSKLSGSLEKLLVDREFDYSDAEIVVEGIPVGVHRCILAARSSFFQKLFKEQNHSSMKEGKLKYLMSELVPYGSVGYEVFMNFLNYLYTGKLKASPPEVSTCVDEGCLHDACRPAIIYAVELMYASATFQMKELVLLVQRRLVNFVEKASVEDVIPILVAAFHCELNPLFSLCTQRVARSNLDSISLEKMLPPEVASQIKSLRLKSQQEAELSAVEVDPMHEKRVRRILSALDSDDVELVRLLLGESDITLDDAFALHYAAAHCDPKVVKELLNLGMNDLSCRNSFGYTVLQVAARRKEPSVIMALLNRGACASESKSDGQNAVTICRRVTRPKDYHEKKEHGKESNNDRLCIDVLESNMRRNATAGKVPLSSMVMANDLYMSLLYLENRVACARMLFPAEARLAMESAHTDLTVEFAGLSASNYSSGNLREVNLIETPIVRNPRLQSRFAALLKTVDMGHLFFPHCSEVLDNFLEDDMLDAHYLEKGTPEEQTKKMMRFMELKDDVLKAFDKDKAEKNGSGLTSSSCSSSSRKVRKR